MKLLVGLGNPGDKYARNRHNVGFMAVERIAERYRFGPWKRKFQGHACDGEIGGDKVMLLKPDTFMNDSGRAVGEAARFLKIELSDIVVFHDELDLLPGKIRVKVGGGNAGHNGLRSISAHLGNEYQRVRIGIGHPGHKDAVQHWVLNDFAKSDAEWLRDLLDAVADSAGWLASGQAERFLTDVARRLGEDDPKSGGKGSRATTAVDTPHPSPPPQGGSENGAPSGSGRHPAGERMGKRQSALAENLKRWMAGKKGGA
jgi:PTH1 family peptidyl-tRNA hydrolase